MDGGSGLEGDCSEFVEVDPTGRYGRYNEILGKGASKTVYRAFDEYEGIEVAWNQVKLHDFLQSPEDLERLYCEIHLLKTLKHENIMKFYTSWVDTANRNINFVTEMFTSGTLRQYRLKHRRVNIRAVKHWCRQILKGLLYLHSRNPPVIHRDLKCDNIFVNGNQGEVKIGDLGLAAILRKSHAACCVGTPEFMAPEVYEEEYNQLVDIYSFGMCILEMVTFEYPYSECTHPAQIYKKVISGKKPEALYKVKDPEVREFVEKCLATVTRRLTARELLKDPFLHIDGYGLDSRSIEYERHYSDSGPLVRQPCYDAYRGNRSSLISGYTNCLGCASENDLGYYRHDFDTNELDLFTNHEDSYLGDVDIAIKGKRREDDGIFLRLRIADKEGRIRNIYFPFDIEIDTALSVATEMVSELDITDQDASTIADMIDGELSKLVPDWKRGLITDETHNTSSGLCLNCASNGYIAEYVSSDIAGGKNLQVLQCSKHGCAAVHGRFEEITYQVEGSEQCPDDAQGAPRPSDEIHYTDIWAQRDVQGLSSEVSKDICCDEVTSTYNASVWGKEERIIKMDSESQSTARKSCNDHIADSDLQDDFENEIRQELRWLKAKYQMQLRELKGQQLSAKSKFNMRKDKKASPAAIWPQPKGEIIEQHLIKSDPSGEYLSSCFSIDALNKYANLVSQKVQRIETVNGSCSPEEMANAKSFYTGALLPHSLHRASSLPVDAVDV